MSHKTLTLFLLITLPLCYCYAQTDSVFQQLQKIPTKYLKATEKKATKYSNRVTGKTEKTLTKLSKWELKIKSILEKVHPETANRLFATSQMTFTTALQKYREGKCIADGCRASYDQYRDELTTQIKYLEDKKELLGKNYLQPISNAKQRLDSLDANIKNTEAIEMFIKERRKLLINESIKYLGKSKYLQKINKESFCYTETLKNYKEIFKDKKKAEETAITILNKIPAFKKFVRENNMLASLFRMPGGNGGSTQSLAGLQTRASVNSLIQDRMGAAPNAREMVQQNMQQAQVQLGQLKDRLLKAGSSDIELPYFKPNMQKTKTFVQRLEYGFNFQAVKSKSFLPGGADLGISIGYRVNSKSVIGLGTSYKIGLGSIDKIRVSHEGIGLRSFMDWKLKKQFFVSGGFEMNYNSSFKKIAELRDVNAWQQSGLLGVSKTVVMKSKLLKGGKLQLLYDFLYQQHVPVSQPVIFRLGYNF